MLKVILIYLDDAISLAMARPMYLFLGDKLDLTPLMKDVEYYKRYY